MFPARVATLEDTSFSGDYSIWCGCINLFTHKCIPRLGSKCKQNSQDVHNIGNDKIVFRLVYVQSVHLFETFAIQFYLFF